MGEEGEGDGSFAAVGEDAGDEEAGAGGEGRREGGREREGGRGRGGQKREGREENDLAGRTVDLHGCELRSPLDSLSADARKRRHTAAPLPKQLVSLVGVE